MEEQNLNKNTHQNQGGKPKLFLSVVGWIFGLFLIVWGFGVIGMKAYIAAAASFVVGIAFLPPMSRRLGLNAWLKAGGVIAWFVILATTMPTADKTAPTAGSAVDTPDKQFKDFLAKGMCNSINSNQSGDVSKEDAGATALFQADENGKKHGLVVFFVDGRITCAECYKHGLEHGTSVCFHENGTKATEYSYKNGKLDGIYAEFDDQGRKTGEKLYLDGKQNGVETGWHANSQKSIERTFVNGNENGISRYWYPGGKLRKEVTFVAGKKHGIERSWHENGVLQQEITFVNGKEDGVATMWNENGKAIVKRRYKNGKYIVSGF
jgi:antitoxin component YwqK of YwqJK toxin-antitoxin module